MPEEKAGRHIEPEALADFLEGKLPEEESRLVREHLDRCALCRLELRKLERFRSIDADEDLARQAEWPYARTKLDSAARHRIIPEVIGRRGTAARKSRAAKAARWLLPFAAAAAFIVLVIRLAGQGEPEAPALEKGPMRGAAVEYEIALEKPVGEIDSLPGVFAWHSTRSDDYFTLEILTSRLRPVYHSPRIAGSAWKTPDSLKTGLNTDIIYLWSVKGYKGVERVISSPNGWFKIIGVKAAPP